MFVLRISQQFNNFTCASKVFSFLNYFSWLIDWVIFAYVIFFFPPGSLVFSCDVKKVM